MVGREGRRERLQRSQDTDLTNTVSAVGYCRVFCPCHNSALRNQGCCELQTGILQTS